MLTPLSLLRESPNVRWSGGPPMHPLSMKTFQLVLTLLSILNLISASEISF